jgi:hypothetical protein
VVVIAALAAAAMIGVPIWRQYPATISEPETVLNLPRVRSDPDLADATATFTQAQLRFPIGDSLFLAAYTDQKTKAVLVEAASGFILRPEHDLDALLEPIAGQFAQAGAIVDVEPGDLGGYAKCFNAKDKAWKQHLGVICGWADHGSIGVVFIFGAQDRDGAARMMLDVRTAVETH